jgi:uncharacterized protein YjbI with pentapeptide repeats
MAIDPLTDAPAPKVRKMVVGVTIVLLVASAIIIGATYVAMKLFHQPAIDATRTAVTFLGVPAAALAAFVTLRRQHVQEKQLHTAQQDFSHRVETENFRRGEEQKSALQGRFLSAAEQMGNDSAAVRLAGVATMAQLADEWDDQRPVCVDVLCGYLRMPNRVLSDGQRDLGDREVRLTAQRLLQESLQDSRWPGIDVNLRGARLEQFQLKDCRVSVQLNFNGAVFEGNTSFRGVEFEGGVFLAHSVFDKTVTFHAAKFQRATFTEAIFRGPAIFTKSEWSGAASFLRTQFLDKPVFVDALVQRRLRFIDTVFQRSPLLYAESGRIVMKGCTLRGAEYSYADLPQLKLESRVVEDGKRFVDELADRYLDELEDADPKI